MKFIITVAPQIAAAPSCFYSDVIRATYLPLYMYIYGIFRIFMVYFFII